MTCVSARVVVTAPFRNLSLASSEEASSEALFRKKSEGTARSLSPPFFLGGKACCARMETLERIFAEIDENGSGDITQDEMEM